MREIRFRFWNEQAHKYHYRANQVMPCLENQVCGVYDYTKEGCVFEQFTGLYDCTKWQDLTEAERIKWTQNGNMPSEWKGREIYEGDIVSGNHDTFTIEYGAFNCGCCGWVYGYDVPSRDESDIKIVGNIHENPELIEANHA